MQYEAAKTELQSPPSGMSLWAMISETGILLVVAFLLARFAGG